MVAGFASLSSILSSLTALGTSGAPAGFTGETSGQALNMHYREGVRANAMWLAAILALALAAVFADHALAAEAAKKAAGGGEGFGSIREPVFVAEIVLLLLTGRLMGELMVR